MANHAYVVSDNLPSNDVLEAELREYIAKRFPQFKVTQTTWLDGIAWDISYNEEVGLICWPSKFTNWYDEAKQIRCIEFRHGHAWHFLWWIEDEIRNFFASKYNAEQWDDGIGKMPTKSTSYFCYADYLNGTFRWPEGGSDPELEAIRDERIQEHIETLPEELHPLITGK